MSVQQGLRFHNLPLLEQAARCAVGCWFNIEQGLCKAVQDAKGPNEILTKEWFGYRGVVRTFRTERSGGDREGIRALLFQELPRLKVASPNAQAGRLVQQLSEKIQLMNAGTRPTSLVSKFAFSCYPTTFVPYDRLGRRQLGTRQHDYVAYINSFFQNRTIVEQELREFIRPDRQVGLAAQNLPSNGNIMDQPLFLARTTDWYLLLQSKFDPIKAKNPVHMLPMV
jgi:hypothetical protein